MEVCMVPNCTNKTVLTSPVTLIKTAFYVCASCKDEYGFLTDDDLSNPSNKD